MQWPTTNDEHSSTGHQGVNDCCDYKKARNGYDHSAEVDRERPADVPQDNDERCRRKNRRYHSGDEIDWGFGRDPDVVG